MKLTLNIERNVVAQARRLAKEQGTDVSSMFSRFITHLARRNDRQDRFGPVTRKATGLIRLPTGKSEREIFEQALLEKYELRRSQRTARGSKSR